MQLTNIFFTPHVIQYPFGPGSGGKFVWNSEHLFVQTPEGVSFATSAQVDEFGVVAKQFGEYYIGGEITAEDVDRFMVQVAMLASPLQPVVDFDEADRELLSNLFDD